MDRPWLTSYPDGVNSDIDIHKYNSLVEIFENSVELYANLPAFSNFGTTISYAEFSDVFCELA